MPPPSDFDAKTHAVRSNSHVLETIFNVISDAAWLKDRDGRFVVANRAYAELYGLEPGDIVGKTCDAFVSPDVAAEIRRTDLQVIQSGQPLEVEQYPDRGDGRAIFETLKFPVVGESGQVIAIVGISRDVTERKRYMATLEAQRDELERQVAARTAQIASEKAGLQAILDATPDLVIVVDSENLIVSIHRGTDEHRWFPADSVEGKCLCELLPRATSDVFRSAIAVARETSQLVSEVFSLGEGEDERFYRARFQPYSHGQTIVVVEDVTANRKLEEMAREQRDRASRVQRINLAGGLAAGIAHELNQPLSSMALYLSQCKKAVREDRPFDRDDLADLLEKIDRCAIQCGEIIRNLRRFLRQRSMEVTIVRVSDLIENAMMLVHSRILSSGAKVETTIPQRLLAMADEVQIQQVLVNLITNALDAMEPLPHDQRRIRISAARQDRWIELTVQDSGVGLAHDAEHPMFDPFFTTKPRGIGMGLAICRNIVEAHGGTIELLPNSDRGAVARFTVPATDAEEMPDQSRNVGPADDAIGSGSTE